MEDAFGMLLNGLPVFMAHSGVSIMILIIGISLYARMTKHDELALIKEGNVAAALSFGGAIIGLAIPLAFSLAASITLWDLVFWGFIALLLQLIAFRLVDLVLNDLSKRLEQGEVAAAVFLVSIKLAIASINAAAISG